MKRKHSGRSPLNRSKVLRIATGRGKKLTKKGKKSSRRGGRY